MIDANPSFLISGTAATLVAPAHATVVSRRVKLVTPGTVSLVTCCAVAWRPINTVASSVVVRNICVRMVKSPRWTPSYVGCTRLFLFDRHRDRRKDADRHWLAGVQTGGVPLRRHDGRGAGAGGCANGGAFTAAEDGAKNCAAHGGATHLRRALLARRVAVAVNRFGRDRHPRAVGQHQRGEADAKPCTLLELAAA